MARAHALMTRTSLTTLMILLKKQEQEIKCFKALTQANNHETYISVQKVIIVRSKWTDSKKELWMKAVAHLE